MNKRRLQRLFPLICLLTYILANGQWAMPVFAWIYPICFMLLIRDKKSIKDCFIVYAMFVIGFMIQFTGPIGNGILMSTAYTIVICIFKTMPYVFYIKSKKNFKSTIIFAMLQVVVEYIIYLIYPILAGLSDAYTQYQNLLLIQIVTLVGIYGITFIINWTAAILVWILNEGSNIKERKKELCTFGLIMMCVLCYGMSMLYYDCNDQQSVRIAGVTGPVSYYLNEDEDVSAVIYSNDFTADHLVRAKRKIQLLQDELFEKSYKEAQAGAKFIMWSELNGLVIKEDEAALLKRASQFAKDNNVYLITSLLVKTLYVDKKENKVVIFDSNGVEMTGYYKYGVSLGELCLKGDGKMQSIDSEYGKITSFICSDLAYAETIFQAGKQGVDIIFDPASDWKEMTPIAIKTAVMRGVENGCAIIRHTNKGMSIATDNSGRRYAYSNYFTSEDKSMVVHLPISGRFTIYPYIGNIFVYLCIVYLLISYVYYIKRCKENRFSSK